MFNQLEHEALMRLMTHATGYTPDSKRIAHWLQEWEQAENGSMPFPVEVDRFPACVIGASMMPFPDIRTLQ